VVALKPDLVIMWASQSQSIESIEEKGIPVYGVFLKSFSDVYKELKDFGILFGKESRADSLIDYSKNEVNKFSSNINKANTKKRVYFMWSQGLLETSGKISTVNELIELADAVNVCQSEQEHLVINIEKLIEWNPEVIVMWNNTTKDPEDILSLDELKNVSAIINKQVYELPSAFFCDFWTLKFQLAVKIISKWCYPEKFANIDIGTEIKKVMKNLYSERGKNLFQ
jgi:iron complex transport system substrate-binding protein